MHNEKGEWEDSSKKGCQRSVTGVKQKDKEKEKKDRERCRQREERQREVQIERGKTKRGKGKGGGEICDKERDWKSRRTYNAKLSTLRRCKKERW